MNESLVALVSFLAVVGVATWLFRPRQGYFWRWRRSKKRSIRDQQEDALKVIHRCQRYGRPADVSAIAEGIEVPIDRAEVVVRELEASGLVRASGHTLQLTETGREYALHIIRAHRLWERYLADSTGFTQDEWHEQADLVEHALSPAEADSLAAELGNPTHDPHGDPIPTATGALVGHGGQPLYDFPLETPLRVVHLEDEPEEAYNKLVAAGLYPGVTLKVLEITPLAIRFQVNGQEQVIPPSVAANVSAAPWPEPEDPFLETRRRLSSLKPGEKGRVSRISPACRGSERRRFLDLGIVPGTVITAEMTSPSGDPTAYRIREALIALRQGQAEMVEIE